MKKPISQMQTFLSVFFVSCLLVANVVTAKQVQFPFGITMTGAVVIFPVTYILSDLFSEVYGYRWSRVTCYLAFAMNLLMVIVFGIVIATPAPGYWKNQDAFATVLGSAPRTLFASLLGFVMGDFCNDRVFQKMKENHPESLKGFGFRAIVSSIVGEAMDSMFFIPIAFIGTMPVENMIFMGITQVILKVAYELIMLPITRICCKKVIEIERG